MSPEKSTAPRIDRRQFLRHSWLIALGVTGALEAVCAENSGDFRKSSAAQAIKNLEGEIGNRELTFSDTRILIPHIVKFYAESVTSNRSQEEIERNILVIDERPPYSPDLKEIDYEAFYQSGWHKDLLSKYPQVKLLHRDILLLIQAAWYGSYAGFYNNEKTFILLKSINENNGTGLQMPYHQFQKIETPTQCAPSTPAVRFRTTLLHELAHGELAVQSRPLDNMTFGKLQEAFNGDISSADVSGFWVKIQTPDDRYISPINNLEELFADYIATKVSVVNGLSYVTLARTDPIDIENLAAVLKQSEVSDADFLYAHQRSEIEYVLGKIGKAVRPDSINRSVHIENGIALLLKLGDWKYYSAHFPKVDPKIYQFYPLMKIQGFTAVKEAHTLSGCTNNNYIDWEH